VSANPASANPASTNPVSQPDTNGSPSAFSQLPDSQRPTDPQEAPRNPAQNPVQNPFQKPAQSQTIGESQAVDPRARRVIDRALAGGESVPEPATDLVEWLNEATPDNPAGRYLTEIWRERTDLWETFPGMFLDPDAAQRFRLWAYHFAAAECGCPAALIPAAPVGITDLIAPPPAGPPPTLTPGVQLYGYLRATLGLGEAARRLVSLLTLADEPTLARPYDHIGSPLAYPWPDSSPGPDDAHDIAVLCVNGAETARLTRAVGGAALHGRYRIGLWFWELEQLTPEMAAGLEHLDEVWVTSEFVANAVRNAAPPNFPVHLLPLGMDVPSTLPSSIPSRSPMPTSTERAATRTRLGMPSDAGQGLVIGFAFDYASRIARKNPLGLIHAFINAFPKPFSLPARLAEDGSLSNANARASETTGARPVVERIVSDFEAAERAQTAGEFDSSDTPVLQPHVGTFSHSAGPWLVIKAFNSGATPHDADRVRNAIAERSDIVLIEQHLSPEDQRAYVSSLDVVASLHRSEGYGLLMLEAMAHGIPTVATEYSGNLAFMNHANSWLVPATRVTVDESAEPYPAGYTWAEPDVVSAASTLRWIVSGLTTSSNRAATDITKRTNQSRVDTRPLLDGSAGASFVRQRLKEIRASRM
jgi:glycosyltransferase involved in cell wall biosynthesis